MKRQREAMTVELIVINAAAAVLLLIAFLSDIKAMRIPNVLTGTFFVLGFSFHLTAGGLNGGYHSLLGASAGFLPLLALYFLKGMGAGDVKLFGALGAWVGASAVLQVLIYAICYAGAIGIIVLFLHKPFGNRLRMWVLSLVVTVGWRKREVLGEIARDGLRFPFMLAVAPGAVTMWLLPGVGL
jgi:prepilin peptidase CpaA